MEKEGDDFAAELQELRVSLEKVQDQQTEDSHTITRRQKTTERYLAKRQMLARRNLGPVKPEYPRSGRAALRSV